MEGEGGAEYLDKGREVEWKGREEEGAEYLDKKGRIEWRGRKQQNILTTRERYRVGREEQSILRRLIIIIVPASCCTLLPSPTIPCSRLLS